MKKYFGILNNEKVNNLKVEELLAFYNDNQLFYVSHTYSIDKSQTENPQIDLKPTQTVINAFYSFLKEKFSRDINQQFLSFFNDYNDRIYGLSNKQQRKNALKEFNKLFKKTKVLKASFVRREKDDNGVENVKNMDRFDFLKGRQNGLKKQLVNSRNVLEFLHGNQIYFNDEKFLNHLDIKQFIEFETNLKILVSLNGQHKFEEDFHFNDLGKLKNLFKKYGNIFNSFDVFIYTHKKIHSFTAAKTANITSLLDALIEMKLVQNIEIDFLNYFNLEHQLKLTNLKYHVLGQNRLHDQRVQQFKLELQEYSTEKVELIPQDVDKRQIIPSKNKNLTVFTDKDALEYLFNNTFNCK